MVCVSLAFVYDAVNVNKIIIISLIKPYSYVYVQVTTGLKSYLHTFFDFPIHGEHFKPNTNTID